MSTEKSFPIVHEFFEQNPNVTFELVTILDMNYKKEPYYCMVVFRNIKTQFTKHVLISPELLRRKYKAGYLYKNGQRVFDSNHIFKKKINITVNSQTLALKNSVVFGNNYIYNKLYDFYNKYFLRQYSYKFDMGDYILVVPAYAVLFRFYFLSSSMKNAIMKNDLGELHYKTFPIEDDTAKIHIKSKANKKDLPYLCRFLYNNSILDKIGRFHMLSNSSTREFSAIESQFPLHDEFTIAVNCKILPETMIDDKPVYYCLNIYNDDSPLGFSKLLYKQYTVGQNPAEVNPCEVKVPKNGRKFKKRKPLDLSGIIKTTTPSNANSLEHLYDFVERDYNTLNLVVKGENVFIGGSKAPRKEDELTKQTNGLSFNPAKKDGDDNTSPVSAGEVVEGKNTPIFTLKDFLIFYEALIEEIGVEEIVAPKLYHIEEIKNPKQNSLSTKCINIITKASRRYLFSVLEYDEKLVYIVEIEHDTSWSPSTWLFVSKDEVMGEADVFADILKEYITKTLTYEQLKIHCDEQYSLAFITHNHKKGEVDDIGIDSWCENLLGKIVLV